MTRTLWRLYAARAAFFIPSFICPVIPQKIQPGHHQTPHHFQPFLPTDSAVPPGNMERRFMRVFSRKRFFAWVPEVLILGRERFRSQVRLLGLAALVGIVAGLGAIVFYVSTRIVEHYALGVVAGYYPEPHPGGEPSMSWLPVMAHPIYPWLLLIVPTVGGLLSGVIVYRFAPEAEGHGTDSVIAATPVKVLICCGFGIYGNTLSSISGISGSVVPNLALVSKLP